MPFTLGELLELPVVATARPEVVHGHHLLGREIRWVHTSEIYEIAPLLKGGEVLLTTGLGLVGASPDQLRGYIADLAGRGVAALVLELGRTFTTCPPAMLEAAREHELPLVVLHGVVPFVEVTETVHQLLIEREVESLRRSEHVNARLTETLLSGSGLRELLECIAELAGRPALLLAGDGRVVAAGGDPELRKRVVRGDGRPGRERNGSPTGLPPGQRTTVVVFGVEWGHLLLVGPPDPANEPVLERGAVAIALELVRTGGLAPARRQARRELLRDIALNRFRSAAELEARAEAVGISCRRGERLVAVCLGVDKATSEQAALNAATEAARQVFGAALVADVDDDVLLAGAARCPDDAALRQLLHRIADTVDAELAATTGGHAVAVTAGPPVSDVAGLVRAVSAAREASALARRLGAGGRVLLASDMAVHQLLARLIDDPELERFVAEQLGPLLEHDARHGRDLVRTLDAYLANGMSKTRTAEALGIRRQTLYARLRRIEALLGELDLRQRERRTALDLALVAWRLRTSALTHRPAGATGLAS